MSPSQPYAHPFLTPEYGRTTSNGEVFEQIFATGNGYAVEVRQDSSYDKFVCQLMIVPQFPGASIYNSVKAGKPPLETTSRDEVTEFINLAIESFMLEVTELKEDLDD